MALKHVECAILLTLRQQGVVEQKYAKRGVTGTIPFGFYRIKTGKLTVDHER